MADRLPPHDQRAEQSVIGSMLRDNTVIDDVLLQVGRDDFYFHAHQLIFQAVVDIRGKQNPVDLVTTAAMLRTRKQIDDIGKVGYLAEVFDSAPTAANAEYYARIIRDRSAARKLIAITTELCRDAYDGARGLQLVEEAERKIFSLGSSIAPPEGDTLQEALTKVYIQIDRRLQHDGIRGISTAYYALDTVTAGMQRGEFSIVAARPGIGKTDYSANVAVNACRAGAQVRIVSLEMSQEELLIRLICRAAEVDSYNLRNGKLNADDHKALRDAFDEIHKLTLSIDGNPYQTVTRIAAAARRHKRKYGLDLLVIDYIQLIEAEDRRIPRHEQLGQVSRRLKLLARELNCHILALCQVNRDSESRQDKKPSMGELRESGAFEQDADVVQILYVPAADPNNPGDYLAVDTQKNRNGRTGEIVLRHEKKFSALFDFTIPEIPQ